MILWSSGLFLPPGHPREATLRDRATIHNPAYDEHEQLVRSRVRSRMAAKPPRTIEAWAPIPAPHPWAGGTLLPRCLELDPEDRAELADGRSAGEEISTQLSVTPRPYQLDAVDAFIRVETGAVVMPCGAGKTTTGVAAIARIGRSALVLVHTVDLAEQWLGRLTEQLPGVSTGLVGDGRKELDADVVVATVQTLANWSLPELYRWGRRFGLVILDEAHHAPAATFLTALSGLPARYRLGLTATPQREDGMTPLLWLAFGGIAYRVTRDELVERGAISPARLTVEKTGWTTTSHLVRWEAKGAWVPALADEAKEARAVGIPVKLRPYAAQLDDMVRDPDRNGRICELAADRVRGGHSVIVLSARVAHCRHLAAELRGAGIDAEALAGRQRPQEVRAILDRARSGETRVLVGTTKADEGLDVPRLSCGILATPSSRLARITQRLGRIERPGDLAGEWIDLVDRLPSAHRAWLARRKLYRALKLEGAA